MNAFVVISRFKVANGISPEVRDAFLTRPHLVDSAPGFLGMEVLSPSSDPDEFWLLTPPPSSATPCDGSTMQQAFTAVLRRRHLSTAKGTTWR